jgi:hypothetical protein
LRTRDLLSEEEEGEEEQMQQQQQLSFHFRCFFFQNIYIKKIYYWVSVLTKLLSLSLSVLLSTTELSFYVT